MLVRDGTHAGEGQAGRGVSHRTEREGRGLAEVIENPIPDSPYREPARHDRHGHDRHDLDRMFGTIVDGRGPNRCGSVARTVARGHHRIGSLRP